MPPRLPKTPGVKRNELLALLASAASGFTLLGASTSGSGSQLTPKIVDESHGAVRAGQDIVLKAVHLFQGSDNNADGLVDYIIVTFVWTNNLNYAIIPKVNHWSILDTDNMTWTGQNGGSVQMIGMPPYYDGMLQRGESHEYTVAFHTPARFTGTLFYDSSY